MWDERSRASALSHAFQQQGPHDPQSLPPGRLAAGSILLPQQQQSRRPSFSRPHRPSVSWVHEGEKPRRIGNLNGICFLWSVLLKYLPSLSHSSSRAACTSLRGSVPNSFGIKGQGAANRQQKPLPPLQAIPPPSTPGGSSLSSGGIDISTPSCSPGSTLGVQDTGLGHGRLLSLLQSMLRRSELTCQGWRRRSPRCGAHLSRDPWGEQPYSFCAMSCIVASTRP